jgi:hypothetical protein
LERDARRIVENPFFDSQGGMSLHGASLWRRRRLVSDKVAQESILAIKLIHR